jgi:hypothetical protein
MTIRPNLRELRTLLDQFMPITPMQYTAIIARRIASVVLAASFWTSLSIAAEGDPVAIRRWPGGMMSIETHWDFHIVVWPSSDQDVASQLPREADLVLFAPDDQPRSESMFRSDTIVVGDHSTDSKWINHTLSRKPNDALASWTPRSELNDDDFNAVHVRTVAVGSGSHNAETTPVVVEVDGVTLLLIPERTSALESQDDLRRAVATVGQVDLIYVADDTHSAIAPASLDEACAQLKPGFVVLGDTQEVRDATRVKHNTFAITESIDEGIPVAKRITLSETPWRMNGELTSLFMAMNKACADSQSVFTKLSATQMNFRPNNGTHTPRWNAEHMMGRQLLFFSQIYHALEPAIVVQDLNPKQMPPDYVPAHSDWTGAEEARQIQRVSAFTRRFAYLMEGLDLDQAAPASRWTPRGLLTQMARHYAEHTANTVKKFDLPEWPRN